jgi:FAD/FMN-containing dehydrogenase/ferredoxin
MISEQARQIAAQCRHYAMCKIDFLGTGLCPSGARKYYVSYYPQGRMDIYNALANNLLPLTEGLVDIANTCTLCGICDKQCHFVTGMRPMTVMEALKQQVEASLEKNTAMRIKEDAVLKDLRKIVGAEWATNDPATLVAYANDPFPLKEMQMPGYVVLPGSKEDIVAIVNIANKRGLPYAIRGNGSSVFGIVFTDGIVLDMYRMKSIAIDRDNWMATVGPGVTSFELQKEVHKQGFRVSVAEPAATVCGNIVCTGIFSTWSNAYGVAADNLINAEFVDKTGRVFELDDREAPNLFSFRNELVPPPGICTKADVRMYPTTEDEEGLMVPMGTFDEAVALARDLSARRIGIALAVLGEHYLSTFMASTAELADKVKENLVKSLDINSMVFMVGDKYARDAVKKMAKVTIDNKLFRMLMLGLPRLAEDEWAALLRNFEGDKYAYEIFCMDEMYPLLEATLAPSPKTLAGSVDEDLRDFYAQLYSRPEMTDLVWLNMFRIISSRMGRHKHIVAFILYVPLDRIETIKGINNLFKEVGDKYGIENEYGFLTPMDFGKRAILEYDYYIDQTSRSDAEKIGKAMTEIDPELDRLSADIKGIKTMKHILSQGCARKEHFLYR